MPKQDNQTRGRVGVKFRNDDVRLTYGEQLLVYAYDLEIQMNRNQESFFINVILNNAWCMYGLGL